MCQHDHSDTHTKKQQQLQMMKLVNRGGDNDNELHKARPSTLLQIINDPQLFLHPRNSSKGCPLSTLY